MSVFGIKEQTEQWTLAYTAFDGGKLTTSLSLFQDIADVSKVHFNVSRIAFQLEQSVNAYESISRAIQCDPFFAVAYFHRGLLLFFNDDIEGALNDFLACLQKLRGNSHINYSQIGMEYILHESHTLLNIGLCYLILGQPEDGVLSIVQALDSAKGSVKKPDSSVIQQAVKFGSRAHEQIDPYQIASNLIFRPPADTINNLQKVNYLEKGVVLTGSDGFNGFSGQKIKAATLGRNYRKVKKTEVQEDAREVLKPLPTVNSQTKLRKRSSSVNYTAMPKSNSDSQNGNIFSSEIVPIQQRRPNSERVSYKDLPKVPIVKRGSSSTDSSLSGGFKAKIHFESTCVMIHLDSDLSYAALHSAIEFKLSRCGLKVKFIDESGHKSIMMNSDDFIEAKKQSPKQNRLELWCFVPSTTLPNLPA